MREDGRGGVEGEVLSCLCRIWMRGCWLVLFRLRWCLIPANFYLFSIFLARHPERDAAI